MNTIQTVNFHGQSLLTIQHDGKPYVGMKAVCENIGLGWRGQNERIQRHAVLKEGMRVIRTPSNGGEQSMLCLPLDMLNGWLFGVDVSRIKREEVRERLLQYQRECFGVLYDYWHKGEAKNPRLSDKNDRTPLKNAVNALVAKTSSLNYSEAYRMVWQRFGVEGVDELTVEQIPQAVAYVHELTLKAVQFGELLPREDKDAEREAYIRNHQAAAISLMHVGRKRYEEQKEALFRLRDQTAEAHDRLKAMVAETRETLDLANAILHGSGAIWDGLHESLFYLHLPDEVMDEGKRRAQRHYKPRILA